VTAVAATAHVLSQPIGRTRAASRFGPLHFVLLSYPLWWALGAGYFIWPLLTFPLLVSMVMRGRLRVPPGFGLWLLFLGWMLVSGTQLEQMSFAYVWRALIYLSATVLFLYVYNSDRHELPIRSIVIVLTLFWAEIVIAGLAGVMFPQVSFRAPLAGLVPGEFRNDDLVRATLYPGLSDVMTILGYPVGRPKALFAYTNQWGACAALLAPFAIAAFAYLRRPVQRQALGLCVVLSIVPFVVSLNRGVWIALGIAVLYAILRLARPTHGRAVVVGAAILLVGAAMVETTPLGGLAHDRVVTDSDSTDTRMSLYASVAEQVREAPVLGVGSPSNKTSEGGAPPVGTQGQIPLLAYSHGLPGLLLFLAWFAHAGLRSARVGSPGRFAAHVALVVGVLLMPYYSLLPVALHAVMVAAALALRDVFRPEATAPATR
jgi:hypothetical protein